MQLDPDFREFVESFNDHDVRFLVAPSVDRRVTQPESAD